MQIRQTAVRCRQSSQRRPLVAAFYLLSAASFLAAGCAGGRAEGAGLRGRTEPAASAGQFAPVSDVAEFSTIGSGGEAAYIFIPKSARGGSAPVVLFFHGLAATDSYSYGGWIDHLVSRGNIVVYPVSEDTKFDRAAKIRNNAISGASAALAALSAGPVKPDLDRVAYVGHSVGGGLSIQIAANARQYGLPAPRAIMAVQPGGSKNPTNPEDVKRLPSSVLLIAIEGDADQFEESREGRMIISNADNIPQKNRAFVLMTSPSSGGGVDHYAPLSPDARYQMQQKTKKRGRKAIMKVFGVRDGETNSIDRQGFWTLFDGLLQAAFTGGSVSEVVDRAGAKPITVESEQKSGQFVELAIR